MEDDERLSAFRISLMNIIEISSLSQPEIQLFSSLTEVQLRNHHDIEQGIFIAESPKVIRVALHAGYEPISLLCERKHIENDAADIIRQCPDIPIYTGEREILNKLTGYTLTRGVLCAMRRKPAPTLEAVLRDAQRVCVIDAVCDTTNIGAIFRSAAALGIDSVLLTKSSCDPLNRRAIRVSMGSVFLVPWTWLDSYDQLREFGFCTAAMALKDQSIALDDPILKQQSRLALIMGTEGDGLPQETIDRADFVVRIPMYHAVDSLNVASAAAVAFWELCRTSRS
jgi:tRNA G18 (ribose-2'-O)-methylase SpoU